MPSSERGRREAGLDGLRALAALSVVCFHVWLYRFPDPTRIRRSGFFGQNSSTRTILTLNPVTWTLCLGVLFYALLPLLGAVGYRWSRGRARRQAALLAGLIGFGVAWNAGVYLLGGNMLATKALPAYLPYFALGMLLALW